jgi:hypothetical protein
MSGVEFGLSLGDFLDTVFREAAATSEPPAGNWCWATEPNQEGNSRSACLLVLLNRIDRAFLDKLASFPDGSVTTTKSVCGGQRLRV